MAGGGEFSNSSSTSRSFTATSNEVIFSDNGDMIDCTKMGVGGKVIPPNIDRVGDMQSDALFVLLVEKDAAFMRLAEDCFYNQFPCIIITAKGQPDVATRLFLKKMKLELNLPVLALVDSDPYGLKILSIYGCGLKNIEFKPFTSLSSTKMEFEDFSSFQFFLTFYVFGFN